MRPLLENRYKSAAMQITAARIILADLRREFAEAVGNSVPEEVLEALRLADTLTWNAVAVLGRSGQANYPEIRYAPEVAQILAEAAELC